MTNDRSDEIDFRRHKQDSNILFIGHLHQILLHLSLNQCDTLTEEKQYLSYFHLFNQLWWELMF